MRLLFYTVLNACFKALYISKSKSDIYIAAFTVPTPPALYELTISFILHVSLTLLPFFSHPPLLLDPSISYSYPCPLFFNGFGGINS